MNTPYRTPPGYGDTFFIYAYNGDGLVNSTDAYNKSIPISDGDFVLRAWSGLWSMASKIQIRDAKQTQLFSAFMGWAGLSGVPVVPELFYPVNGLISIDLSQVARLSVGADGGNIIYASQICFYGVRRRRGVVGDPQPSYSLGIGDYYKKPYSIQYQFDINKYASSGGVSTAPDLHQVPVRDLDFVLEKIRVYKTNTGTYESPTSTFTMWLYGTNGIEKVSNVPIISKNLVNFPNDQAGKPTNFFPTPPILYRNGSSIRFEIGSLMLAPTALPASYTMEFIGHRRVPCR
jgi:hypothetical protein